MSLTQSAALKFANPFSRSARYYDLVHAKKRYRDEASILVDRLGARNRPDLRIIDYGCGTGNFTRELYDLGCKAVVGCDVSQELLGIAREKNPSLTFVCRALAEKFSPEPANGACCMFGAFSYAAAESPESAARCLAAVRSSVYFGSKFCFDVINISAAAAFLRERTASFFELPDGEVLHRVICKQFNPQTCIVENLLYFQVFDQAKEVIDGWQELHLMRAFSPPEITDLLRQAGFHKVFVTCPLESAGDSAFVSASDFYFSVTAQAM